MANIKLANLCVSTGGGRRRQNGGLESGHAEDNR